MDKFISSKISQFQLFDSHFHIIDKKFPLVPNNGYIPSEFTCDHYLTRMVHYNLIGGAIVSGSFQAFDQSYLINVLKILGSTFVGVTQLKANTSDDEMINLHRDGVRAIRFNLKRGGSEGVKHLTSMASRVYDLNKWHVELYVDSDDLPSLYNTLIKLPSVSIDHLGLSKSGLSTLIKLAEKGVQVKATGFGRVNFDIKHVLRDLYSANPSCLMFGSDLPSTRSPNPYSDRDFMLVIDALGEDGAKNVFSENALHFYRLK